MNQNLKNNNLINQIIEHTYGFSKISIFVHMNPDFDAIGSAFGLARILKLNTFATEVKIVGIQDIVPKDFKNLFDFKNEIVEDDFIKESIAFIVDTANSERVLSQKHLIAKKTVLIDHHIKAEKYTDYAYINENAIATCEMLASELKSGEFVFDIKTLNYLFLGIITDSNRFMYDKVTKNTHEVAGWLIENGVESSKLLNQLYERELESIYIDQLLLNHFQIKNNVGYIVVQKDWNEKYNFRNWSDKVYLLANIKEIKVWFITYFDEQKQLYKVSIRSSYYPVVEVAQQFGGGGHRLASGCVLKNIDELENFISKIDELIKRNN